MEVSERSIGAACNASWAERTMAGLSAYPEFSLGHVDSMEFYWSQVTPNGPFLMEQGDPWDVLMM